MSDYISKLTVFDANVKELNGLFLPSLKKVELLKQIDADIQELFISIPKGDEKAKTDLVNRVDAVSTLVSKNMPRLFIRLFPNQTRESLALITRAERVKQELLENSVKLDISRPQMRAVGEKLSLAFEMVKTYKLDYLLNKRLVMNFILQLGNVLTDVKFALEHCSEYKERDDVMKIVTEVKEFFQELEKDKDMLFQPYTYIVKRGGLTILTPYEILNKDGDVVSLCPSKEVLKIAESISSKNAS